LRTATHWEPYPEELNRRLTGRIADYHFAPTEQARRNLLAENVPDPDIIVIDPSFGKYLLGITAIHPLWTGGKWLEGPVWSRQGNYLVYSDVHANVTYRLLGDDMRVTKFSLEHGNSDPIDADESLVDSSLLVAVR